MTTELAQDDEFLPELRQGVRVTGLAPSGSVEVVTVERYGAAAANVVYRTFDGRMDERVVLAGQESDLRVIVDEPAARFDGDGELFRLGMEARRIAMAARFDPMLAVTTSDLEPVTSSWRYFRAHFSGVDFWTPNREVDGRRRRRRRRFAPHRRAGTTARRCLGAAGLLRSSGVTVSRMQATNW